jgi:hypothetical protein
MNLSQSLSSAHRMDYWVSGTGWATMKLENWKNTKGTDSAFRTLGAEIGYVVLVPAGLVETVGRVFFAFLAKLFVEAGTYFLSASEGESLEESAHAKKEWFVQLFKGMADNAVLSAETNLGVALDCLLALIENIFSQKGTTKEKLVALAQNAERKTQRSEVLDRLLAACQSCSETPSDSRGSGKQDSLGSERRRDKDDLQFIDTSSQFSSSQQPYGQSPQHSSGGRGQGYNKNNNSNSQYSGYNG